MHFYSVIVDSFLWPFTVSMVTCSATGEHTIHHRTAPSNIITLPNAYERERSTAAIEGARWLPPCPLAGSLYHNLSLYTRTRNVSGEVNAQQLLLEITRDRSMTLSLQR